MATIKFSPLNRGVDSLYHEVQAIEKQLQANFKLTPAAKELLFQELEGTHQTVLALRAKAVSVNQFGKNKLSSSFEEVQSKGQVEELDGLKDKIITLYGDINTRAIESEVRQISEETAHLQDAIVKGDSEEIAKDVAVLSKHINSFCKEHQTLREDRKVINLAKRSLKDADHVLHQKVIGQTINQFNILALRSQQLEEIAEDEELEPQVMELFETAELFYKNKKEATRSYNQLPESLKARVRQHLSKLGGEGIGTDSIKTVQALIATAHEIAGSEEDYLTPEQLAEMYQELGVMENQEQQALPRQFWLQA